LNIHQTKSYFHSVSKQHGCLSVKELSDFISVTADNQQVLQGVLIVKEARLRAENYQIAIDVRGRFFNEQVDDTVPLAKVEQLGFVCKRQGQSRSHHLGKGNLRIGRR
jgi:hypothetical protein